MSEPAFRERVLASPLARRLAADKGFDLAELTGTGPGGRIVKRDVETLAEVVPLSSIASVAPAVPAVPILPTTSDFAAYDPDSYERVRVDGMRKTVARRLTESKSSVPHFYLSVDCELDRLLALRKELNAKSPEGEGAFKISVNDFIIRASALALKRVPGVNASWAGDAILMHAHADISIAVALDGGLITPIVRSAETKGIAEIANEMKDLGARARARKLTPKEYQGGTFSISNLGMFGIKEFSAVINPPQGAILAVGAGEERPVVKDGALAIATVMSLTLSCDHRVVDGALGAEFLSVLKGFVEDPITMLLLG